VTDGLTIGRLVGLLGRGVLDVLAAPEGLDVSVLHDVIHDRTEPTRLEAGDLALAVGLSPDDEATAALVRSAGAARAAAVVLKTREPVPDSVLRTAEEAGVALLAAAPDITWAQLHALVRSAIAGAGRTPDSTSGGAPLGDLFALANAVAVMVGGPTTIEDPRSHVLAYSNLDAEIDEPRRRTILGRQVPDDWMELLHKEGVFRRLATSSDVVRIGDLSGNGSLRPRIAVGVRAGDELLGSIWVAEGDTPFDARAEEALRQAADIAALHLVRSRAVDDLDRRERGEQLRALLDGRGPVSAFAARLGVADDQHFVVVAFDLQTDDDAEVALKRERALDLITLFCESFRRQAVSAVAGRVIYTLLPLRDAEKGFDGVRRLVHDVVERASQSLTVGLWAGMGSPVAHLRDVTTSRREADQALRLLRRRGTAAHIAAIDDVREQALLLELRDIAAERPHLLVGRLDRLLAHDAAHHTDYVETLRAYFDAAADVPRAAEAMGVHANTLRYRLRRLCEIADLDLTEPEERLAVELQLRLR
jgi:sugar diacid utilization regulator